MNGNCVALYWECFPEYRYEVPTTERMASFMAWYREMRRAEREATDRLNAALAESAAIQGGQ